MPHLFYLSLSLMGTISKVHFSVAEETTYLHIWLHCFCLLYFASNLMSKCYCVVSDRNGSAPVCQFQRTKVLLLVAATYSPTN